MTPTTTTIVTIYLDDQGDAPGLAFRSTERDADGTQAARLPLRLLMLGVLEFDPQTGPLCVHG